MLMRVSYIELRSVFDIEAEKPSPPVAAMSSSCDWTIGTWLARLSEPWVMALILNNWCARVRLTAETSNVRLKLTREVNPPGSDWEKAVRSVATNRTLISLTRSR